jgi:hypothetical protein
MTAGLYVFYVGNADLSPVDVLALATPGVDDFNFKLKVDMHKEKIEAIHLIACPNITITSIEYALTSLGCLTDIEIVDCECITLKGIEEVCSKEECCFTCSTLPTSDKKDIISCLRCGRNVVNQA